MSLFQEKFPQEYLEIIQKLRLIDDTLFATCLDGNKRAMGLILRVILGRDDIVVRRVVTQQSAQNLYGRGVRFDVLAMDSTGKLYNCEVQRADAGAIPRRARYNGGLIDSRELAKGTAFKELPETYIIFITENDVFHAGLPLYHVERTIQELSRSFDDGMHILYVNGTCRDDTALGKLMQDFFQPDAGKFNYRELAEPVDYYKSEEKGVAAMCEIMEQFGAKREAKGRLEGLQEGAKDNAKKTALRLMEMKMPLDQIATATGLARSEVDSLARGRSA